MFEELSNLDEEMSKRFAKYEDEIKKEMDSVNITEILKSHYSPFKQIALMRGDTDNKNIIDCLLYIDELLTALHSDDKVWDEIKQNSKDMLKPTIDTIKNILQQCLDKTKETKKIMEECMDKMKDVDSMNLQDLVLVYRWMLYSIIPNFLLRECYLLISLRNVYMEHEDEIHEEVQDMIKNTKQKEDPTNPSSKIDMFGNL